MRACCLAALVGCLTAGAATPSFANAAGHPGALLILRPDGRTALRAYPYLPGSAELPRPARTSRRLAAAVASAHGPSLLSALRSLERAGEIAEADYARYRTAYLAARHSLRRLSGTRATELRDVLANVEAIAAQGQLAPSRLPLLFLTLERNRQWWSTGPLLSYGRRIGFPGSQLVWEYYPGQGIEVQWLATFGEANGFYLSGADSKLQAVLGEALPLASRRAGGIAWEYMFHFDGGAPPWTSGLSQGTALQAFARAGTRLHEAAYLTAAKEALAIFQTPPPEGVRVPAPYGAHYLEYTYAPQERILNGFIQAVIGLYDYTQLTHDPLGEQLFEAGDAEARAEVPHYDTGAWSLYDQGSESDLNYHELVTTFLQNLCERTRRGLPLPAPEAAPPAPQPGTPPAPEASGASGGTAAAGARGARALARAGAAGPIAGDEIYCETAEKFREYMHEKPAISLLSHTLPGGARAGVRMRLSKISRVTLSVRRGRSLIWSNTATVSAGTPRLLWPTPRGGGSYSITLQAVDLAGNSSTVSGTVTLRPPPARRPAHRRSH